MNNKIMTICLAVVTAFGIGYFISTQNNDAQSNTNNLSSEQQTEPDTSGGASLDVSGQQLTSLPDSILSRSDLASLNLSNNQLASLPAAISRLSNLETLNVENNRLETFPSEISQLKKLREIKANNNRLTSLPPSLANMNQLSSLDISGNNISASQIEELRTKLPNTEIKQ